jgi:hypothetical protein
VQPSKPQAKKSYMRSKHKWKNIIKKLHQGTQLSTDLRVVSARGFLTTAMKVWV